MKEELKEIVNRVKDRNKARMIAREYLQARILKFFQDAGAFDSIVFLGGTALRFLYSLKRFSEDLDFSIDYGKRIDFERLLRIINKRFELDNYNLDIKIKKRVGIYSAFIKFKELLYEIGLSNIKSEILSIKIEVDSNPPEEGIIESSIIRKYVLLNIKHFDLTTLFAGKLNAIFTREYTKGRDIYDLFWFLTAEKKIIPNFGFLKNALSQFNYKIKVNEDNYKKILVEKIEELKWKIIQEDLKTFIEDHDEIKIITKENLIKLIKNY